MIENDELLNPNEGVEEGRVDRAVRPKLLADYQGQENVCQQMEVFIKAANARNEALDHVLIFGPPGLGKTTLANIIANEMKVKIKQTSGPVLEKAADLAAILTNLEENDVLFIDEIHRLSPQIEEILYPAMEDYELDIVIGEGPTARSIKLELPPFTLVGATTRAGLLTSPLRDRFGIVQRLQFYDSETLARIILRTAKLIKVNIDNEACLNIAKRSRGTPRIANRLLRRVRDFAEVKGNGTISYDLAINALDVLEVDLLGLDYMDRKYLSLILEQFEGGPVGLDSIAAALSEEKGTIEDVIEPYLIQQGFLNRTSRGRTLSKKVYEHFGLKFPEC